MFQWNHLAFKLFCHETVLLSFLLVVILKYCKYFVTEHLNFKLIQYYTCIKMFYRKQLLKIKFINVFYVFTLCRTQNLHWLYKSLIWHLLQIVSHMKQILTRMYCQPSIDITMEHWHYKAKHCIKLNVGKSTPRIYFFICHNKYFWILALLFN